MSKQVNRTLELTCGKCGAKNPSDRLYCAACAGILDSRVDLWLRAEELQTSADRDAVGIIKSTGILPHLAYQFFARPREEKLREMVSRQGTLLNASPSILLLIHEAAFALSIETVPAVYSINMPGPPNAFTFGSKEPSVIVVDRRLVEGAGRGETLALLGHEMGHIKAGNMLYHNLALTLAEGFRVSTSLTGSHMLSMPIQLGLLAWQRESEFSSDRAALVASGQTSHVLSMFARLTGTPHAPSEDTSSPLDHFIELFQTHPMLGQRARAVVAFSETEEYANIKRKAAFRREFRLKFTPNCRFCGSRKPIEAVFCPACARSQL